MTIEFLRFHPTVLAFPGLPRRASTTTTRTPTVGAPRSSFVDSGRIGVTAGTGRIRMPLLTSIDALDSALDAFRCI